ncbi:hypothetical protein ACJX0J_030573, partial [Zea mays]
VTPRWSMFTKSLIKRIGDLDKRSISAGKSTYGNFHMHGDFMDKKSYFFNSSIFSFH